MSLLIVIKYAIVAFFAVHAGLKLFGYKGDVALFEKIGFGQGFRYVTGLTELAGALLLAFEPTQIFGAVLLLGVTGGAIVTQIRILKNWLLIQEAIVGILLVFIAANSI